MASIIIWIANKETKRASAARSVAIITKELARTCESHIQVCTTTRRRSIYDLFFSRLLDNRNHQFFEGGFSDAEFYFPVKFAGIESQVNKEAFFNAWNSLDIKMSLDTQHSLFVTELLRQPGSANLTKLKIVFSADSPLVVPIQSEGLAKPTSLAFQHSHLCPSKNLVDAHSLKIACLTKLKLLDIQLYESSEQRYQLMCFEFEQSTPSIAVTNANSTGIKFMLNKKWPHHTVFENVDQLGSDIRKHATTYFYNTVITEPKPRKQDGPKFVF